MPQVFRIMSEDEDALPQVTPTAIGLGVRPEFDVDLGPNGHVLVNGKGMSVNPNWRNAPLFRIPKRLRNLKTGARGPNTNACFRFGEGAFQQGQFAAGLTLEPDSPTHGTISPNMTGPLVDYEAAIAATRAGWQKDET